MLRKYIDIIVFAVFLFFASCNALEDFSMEEPEKVPVVVEGILVPEFPPVVWLSELSDTNNINDTSYIPVNDAKVTLFHNGSSYKLSLYDSDWGEYSYQGDDLKIVAGDTYFLEINYMDRLISAETSIPFQVKNISAVVKPTSRTDSAVLNISWESVDDSYFYLFLEGDTTNVSGSYCSYSEYPFAGTTFTIDTTGLTVGDTYYIIIYSLPDIYAQYYFGYDPLNNNYNYESNILDAYGIFTGINLNYISFEYQEDLNIKLQAQIAPPYIFQSFPGRIRR